MRRAALLVLMLLFSVPAAADSLPACPPGQVADCETTESGRECNGCVDDPNAGGGCAVAPAETGRSGAAALTLLALFGLARLRRRG